jgi:hypothetical protein
MSPSQSLGRVNTLQELPAARRLHAVFRDFELIRPLG